METNNTDQDKNKKIRSYIGTAVFGIIVLAIMFVLFRYLFFKKIDVVD